MTFSEQILDYHFSLKTDLQLPPGVSWLMPYGEAEVRRCMTLFYDTYMRDNRQRIYLLGINPGRFGAGVTGIPFTDPIRLDQLGIRNAFTQKPELSSVFIYDMIDACGGAREFYKRFYITSLCPLGLVRDGKNFNYYDDRDLLSVIEPFLVANINTQLNFGANREVAYCLGQGENLKHVQRLNAMHGWWKRVVPLPHPRWIMQYRLKSKVDYIRYYRDMLVG